jgi:hypothetical protein
MTLHAFLVSLQDSAIGQLIGGGSGWGWCFPNVETIHVLSTATVFGSILMVDLRLLGVSSRDSAVSKLSQEILPYTWAAFALAVISGSLLFISKADTYFFNLQFRLKFLFMALAGINMLVFHFGAYKRVLQWDNKFPPPAAARLAGALSLVFWVVVIFMGRWIGYTT